jgi:effector-binding domain-containing protein
MFKNIIYIIVIVIFIFLVVGLFLPREVHVERAIAIDRPASTVFAVLDGFHSFQRWSPWLERDPQAVYEISGPRSGLGARLDWSGDPRLVGTGWQEIVESRPPRSLRMQLDFGPQGRARSYFQLDPDAAGTRLTWGFDSDLTEGQGWLGGILARYFGLFFDHWLGADYEQGLARLKVYAESLPAVDFTGLHAQLVRVEAADILFIRDGSALTAERAAPHLTEAHSEIFSLLAESGMAVLGPPMVIVRGGSGQRKVVEAAVPASLPPGLEPPGDIRSGRSPAGLAAHTEHRGPYGDLAATHERLAAWIAAHGLTAGDVAWELYLDNPADTPPDERVTQLFVRVEDD